jgi:hypothetical protein
MEQKMMEAYKELKETMTTNIKEINVKLNKNDAFQVNFEKKCEDIERGVKVVEEITQKELKMMNEKFESISKNLEKNDAFQENVEKKCENIERGVKFVEENAQKEISWTEVVKKQQKKKSPAVIIKPKNPEQKRDDTKSSIKDAIDPGKFGVKSMLNASKGAVVVTCDDDESCEKLLTEAFKKLGGNYNVQKPRKLLPRIKMLRVNDPDDDNEVLIKELKRRNPIIEHDLIEIIKREQVKRNGHNVKGCFNIVLQMEGFAFNKVMDAGRLLLGWNSCKVVDNIYIRRCFKCLGYNHNSAECRNKGVCGQCGSEDHEKKDCTSQEIKCGNCLKTNARLKMHLNTDHNIWSTECPVYINKLNVSKRNIQYID